MLGSRRAWAAAAALAAGYPLAFPAPALAGEHVESIAIAYTADDTMCPTRERFVGTLRQYTTHWKLAESSAGVRAFHVRLVARGAIFAGTLAVTSPDGKTTTREIVAPTCEALARGLVIVMALAIDPQAQISSEPAASEPAPSPEHTEPRPQPTPLPPPPAPAPAPSPIPPPPPRHPLRVIFTLEGRVELTSAVTTGVLPVFGAALDARMALGDSLPKWLSPALAVGVRQSLPKDVDIAAGTSRFVWTAATIRLCPVRFVAFSSRLDVVPCAEANVGVLHASARGVPDARSTAKSWIDRGLSLHSSFRINESLSLGAGVLVTAPITRHRFALVTDELISRAPPVGITGGLRIEWRL